MMTNVAFANPPELATLRITVVDAASSLVTPARIELLDRNGVGQVPNGVLSVTGDCRNHPGANQPPPGGIFDPASETTHFYVIEPVEIALPAGRYRVTAQKGIEYERRSVDVELVAGARREVNIELPRWANLAESGWFSADDHLHIGRPANIDPTLVDWMRAEDLNVANLLQMGDFEGVIAAPQRSFGAAAIHQDGVTIIASAQENPRTWLLGHAIILGARSYIDFPNRYLRYRDFWKKAHAQGALNGYAHWGAPGTLLDAPFGWIDFLEILQFDISNPSCLYDLLNLGFRVTPTAGTDFPCGWAGPPGSQRFYTRVEGTFTYSSWLEGVRLGRTFVTNGPLLDFSIDNVGIGGDVRLDAPGKVRLSGAVRFDPQRHAVERLELVQEGEVVHVEEAPSAPGVLSFDTVQPVDQSTWFALRATGTKVGVRASGPAQWMRPSEAHSGAIFVEVAGTPPLAERARAAEVARRVLSQLDQLADQFSPEAIDQIQGQLAETVTGIDAEVARRNRGRVLKRIEAAREVYEHLGGSVDGPERDPGTRGLALPPLP
jgi:hypothetical protein